MNLCKADIEQLLKTLNNLNVDSFKLIKNDTSGIGYTLDIEYNSNNIYNKTLTITTRVVGTEDW